MLESLRASKSTKSAPYIEQLTRAISHDIGAPIRHLVHFSHMLTNIGVDQPLQEKHLRWLGFIHDGSQRLQDMLAALNKFVPLSSAQVEPDLIELKKLFEQQLTQYRQSHQFSISYNETWPEVVGIKLHWQTLFSSLLENACRFQPKSPEHVIDIVVKCEQSDSSVCFEIEDNGIGITEKRRQEVFLPFRKLNHPEDYDGIGMGLAYCDYIAQINNGDFVLSDSEKNGLKITYIQPLIMEGG